MAGTYTINYSDAANGTFDVFPHEVNGANEIKNWNLVSVSAGTAGTGTFTIYGNFIDRFVSGFAFSIVGSTGNNGVYTTAIAGSTFTAGANNTTINVNEIIVDGTADGSIQYAVENDTSLSLSGRGSINYGLALLENLVHVLENFSNPTAPVNPSSGQLWFQNDISVMWVYNGVEWISPGSVVSGTTQPLAPALGDLWYDTNPIPQLRIYNGTVYDSIADQYLPITGGTITGDLIIAAGADLLVNGNAFTSTATTFSVTSTVTAISGTTVTIDSTGINDYVNITANGSNGGVNFKVGNNVNTLVIEPTGVLKFPALLNYTALITDDDHVVTKKYVDDSPFVNLAGGVMTGILTLSGDPTAALHPVSKQFIEANYIPSIGGIVTGDLDMGNTARMVNVQDPTNAQDVSTKTYVDTKFIKIVGDTFTGPLVLNADPVVALEATTKQYVDARVDAVEQNTIAINSGASPYAITNSVNLLVVDATGANIVIDLSVVTGTRIQPLTIKRTDNSANTVTIVASGGDTIDGSPSVTLATQWSVLTIADVGTEWLIIA